MDHEHSTHLCGARSGSPQILYSTSSAITNLNVNIAIHNSTNIYTIVVEKCHLVIRLCCSHILDDKLQQDLACPL